MEGTVIKFAVGDVGSLLIFVFCIDCIALGSGLVAGCIDRDYGYSSVCWVELRQVRKDGSVDRIICLRLQSID